MIQAQQLLIVGFLRAAHGVERVFTRRLLVQTIGKQLAACRVFAELDELLGQRLMITRLEDIAVFTRVNQLAHAANVRADGRTVLQNAFQNGVREGLGHRGQKVNVHGRKKLVDRRYPTAERHTVGNAQVFRQITQHFFVLAIARDEQAQLGYFLDCTRKTAHTGCDILNRGQTRSNAAQHIVRRNIHVPVFLAVSRTVNTLHRIAEIHTVIDGENLFRVEAARNKRARHTVSDRLVEIQKAQRNGICQTVRPLLERISQIVIAIVRVYGGQHRNVHFLTAQHRADQIGLAAMTVDDIRLKVRDDLAHLIPAVQRVETRNDAHVDAVLCGFTRERAVAE